MSIGEQSRYRRTLVLLSIGVDGTPSRRLWADRIPRLTNVNVRSIRQYEVLESDTWFTIAAKLYGDSRLWWIIAEYNNVIDPFSFLTIGRKIVVPSRDVVFFDVLDFESPDVDSLVGSPL